MRAVERGAAVRVAERAPWTAPTNSRSATVRSARALTDEELDQALSGHPRIGQRSSGTGAAASFSRAEQSASQSADADLAARLEAGNAAYEAKFGRVFLIRAAGRDRPEILAELERRLRLDPAAELEVVGAELRGIALLRIPQLFAHLDAVALDQSAGYDDGEAAR